MDEEKSQRAKNIAKKKSFKCKGPLPGGLSEKTMSIINNLDHPNSHQRQTESDEESQAEEEKRGMTVKILLLGDSGVGKTSLMLRYTDDRFSPNLLSTAGVDFKVLDMNIDGRKVRCQIWDTAGQDKFHVITRAYYRGAHGIALVYDIADADSFKNVNYWMANIQTHTPAMGREAIRKLLLGNKIDLPPEAREVSSAEGREVSEEFGVKFFEVSAKDGSNVTEAFNTIVREIVKGLELEAQVAAGAGGLKMSRWPTKTEVKPKNSISAPTEAQADKCNIA